ncbi:MAG: P-loop ATPase, partial [Gammaproteobacteria bacterium]|nr:P-loop ATPase [Gammaproteobacteria bacterium]
MPRDDVAAARRRAEAEAWKIGLRPGAKGFIGDEFNAIHALRNAPELAGLIRYNEFALAVEFTRSPPWRDCPAGTTWTETDDTALQVWMQGEHINVRGRATVADSVALVATDASYHPVRDYLDGLQWDGEQRLATWLQEYLNAAGSDLYLAAIGPAFLRSAVARIQKPGCQVDHVLVLEASQGYGKTSAVRALGVKPDWYAGSLPDVHNKDAALQLVARWIVEVAELKAIRNSQVEAVKAFITETADTFRPP